MISENDFNTLTTRAKTYKYSSMNYIEFVDCKNAIILHDSHDLIFLQDTSTTPAMLYFATNNFNLVIDAVAKLSGQLRIHFVPRKFASQLKGFTEWAELADFFNTDLQNTSTTHSKPEYLNPNECEAVAQLSQRCKLQSRGFEGETAEWFSKWQRENKVIIVREASNIVGFCCVSIYDIGTGITLLIAMLAVNPAFQGMGYGKKLLEQAIDYGVENGAAKGFLHADVLNKNAIGLYNKYNFHAAGDYELQMITNYK